MRTLALCLVLFVSSSSAQYVALRHSTQVSGPPAFVVKSANIKAGDTTDDTVDVQLTVPAGLSNAIAIAGVSLRYTYGGGVVAVQNVTDAVAFNRAEVRDAEHYGAIWYQTGITAGAKTFRLTCSGSTDNCLWVAIYSNAAQSASFRDSAFASGNGASPTLNINSHADDLVIDHLYEYNGSWTAAITAGANQTKRIDYHENSSPTGHIGMSEESGAASVTMSWTIETAREYTLVAVSLKRAN